MEKLSYYILNGKVTKEMNGGGTSWLILCIKGGKAGDNKRLQIFEESKVFEAFQKKKVQSMMNQAFYQEN